MLTSTNNRSKFEDLSDDILMDIFDLLNPPMYMYHSFYNLNSRLNRIMCDSRLLMSLDFSQLINPSNFAYHCQTMLPNMFKQLISLRLSNEFKLYEQMKVFLQHFQLTQFHVLRQLSLIQITFEQLKENLSDILSLKKLNRLHIDTFDGSGVTFDDLHLIANTLVSQSSSIQSLHLRFNRELVIYETISSSLVHLHLDTCFSSDIPQLLSHCTDLQSLSIKVEQAPRRYSLLNSFHFDEDIHCQHLSSTFCHHLTYLSLDINDLTFTDVKFFLSNMPYLIRLRLEGLSYDIDFSKGDLWQKIFENQTKKLQKFQMNGLRIWLENRTNTDQQLKQLIDQITCSFGPTHSFWGQFWSVNQTHELRSNHLNLTLHAKAF